MSNSYAKGKAVAL